MAVRLSTYPKELTMPKDANDVHQQPSTTSQALVPPSGNEGIAGAGADEGGSGSATLRVLSESISPALLASSGRAESDIVVAGSGCKV